MNSSGVYAITNTVNEKVYIGSSVRTKSRINHHRHMLRSGTHHNPHLQSAWKHYGEQSFSFSLLESTPPDQLLNAEQYHITKRQSANRNYGYNLEPLAFRPVHSAETRAKISAALTGKKLSSATRIKLRQLNLGQNNPNFGLKRSLETCSKLSAAHRGRPVGEDTRRLISDALTGRINGPPSAETRTKISISNTGHYVSEVTRSKISKAQTGKHLSEETKSKISTAHKLRCQSSVEREKLRQAALTRWNKT